jgi:HEAT repeat protein
MARTAGCQEVEALMQALADGGLTAAERAILESHLAGCPACTAEAARLRDNAVFLQEVLSPLRLAPDFTTDFLFRLPKKDPKRKAAPAPSAGPRTMVIGGAEPRRRGALGWVLGVGLLGAAGVLAWAYFGRTDQPFHREILRPAPEVKPRPEKGLGAADPRGAGGGTAKSPPPGTGSRPAGGQAIPVKPGPAGGASPVRTAAELVATLRGVRGDTFGAVIQRGWDLLAGSPAEAKAARELASKEKDPRVKAALVLCLGSDGGEEARAATRSFLGDESPEVRGAAALALARSLSFENPAGKVLVHSGPPLGLGVPIGALADDPGRGELLARLSSEGDAGVRRVLVQALGPTAASDAGVRDHILDGVKGAYGDDMREACVASLKGVQDPSVVAAFAAALEQPGTPKSLYTALVEGMVAADARAAAEVMGDLIPKAESPDLRCQLVTACARVGGAAAQKAVLAALSDQDAKVRLAAVAVLRRFPSREVLDAVQKAAENDADQAVRQEGETVAALIKASMEKLEGPREVPPGDNPPAPAPAPAPVPAGGGN